MRPDSPAETKSRSLAALGMTPAAVAALTLLLVLALVWPSRSLILTGANDFLSFYAGARLAGTGDLYNPARASQIQLQAAGTTGERLRYIRLPWFAGLLWPLGRLPYAQAYLIWQCLNAMAFLGFLALWPPSSSPGVAVAGLSFLPVYWSLVNGQDLTLLLLWIAGAVRLVESGRPLAAGLLFSLCAAKFHLFALVPVLVIRRRLGRFAAGSLAGLAGLLAISFAVAGPTWPQQYLQTVWGGGIHPGPEVAPNVYRLAALPRWALAACVVAAVWIAARRGTFQHGLAITLLGGVLISPHVFLQDLALWLPAALAIRSEAQNRLARVLAALLLTPVCYLVELALPPPWGAVLPLAGLLLIYAAAFDALRARRYAS